MHLIFALYICSSNYSLVRRWGKNENLILEDSDLLMYESCKFLARVCIWNLYLEFVSGKVPGDSQRTIKY